MSPIPNSFNFLSPPPNPLSYFSDYIDHLAAAVSSTSTPSDSSSCGAHLESTISLLNTCNTISARIERLRLGCLRVKFALHLLSSPSGDHLSCAKKELSEWEVLSCDTASDFGLVSVEEVDKTNTAVRRLSEVIDSGEINGEELRVAVVEMEKSAEELTLGLDRLAGAVNKLFTVVIGSRNAALDSYRVGPQKCK